MKNTVILSSIILIGLAATCSAATIIVDVNGDGHFETIQAAIDDANEGDTIEIWPGTYTGDGNRDVDFLGKALTIRSTDPNDPDIVAATIIDCNSTTDDFYQGFYFHSGEDANSVLNGLTITNGCFYSGGGICCENNSSPLINNCIIINNQGGGIYLSGSSPSITNCVITRNTIFTFGSYGFPGGIRCYGSNSIIKNCVISENKLGIYCMRANPVITNCTIHNNSGDDWAAAIWSYQSNLTITSCTISRNTGKNTFFGFYAVGLHLTGSNLTISNSILSDNAQMDGYGIVLEDSSSLTVSYSNIKGGQEIVDVGSDCFLNWNQGVIDAEPQITYDGHLRANSPCIDAGDPCYCPTPAETDIDAEQRIFGDYIDMGADEFIDTDGDHLPDFWEQKYFGSPVASQPDSLPSADPDGDGYTNIEEYELYSTDPTLANGTTYYVDANRPDDSGDGLSWQTAKRTIQAAIDQTANINIPDRVIIAEGLYTGAGNYNLDPDGRSIIIQSTDPNDPNVVASTIIDPNWQGRGFIFTNNESPDCVVSGLTVTNGQNNRYSHDDGGGGFYISSAGPTVKNCIITGNFSWGVRGGGGLYLYDSSAAIINCKISQNNMEYGFAGGGIFCRLSNPTIKDCSITDNFAENGCGIYCGYYSSPKIINCLISRNKPEWYHYGYSKGGGIFCAGSNPTINNCTITENTAWKYGGGIYLTVLDTAIITNCIISGNYAGYGGGGLYCRGGTDSIITNCIISGNSAWNVGGICCSKTSATVTNSILWANKALGDSNEIYYYSTEPVISYCDIQGGWDGLGNINLDPCFVDLGYWDANGTPDYFRDDFWVDGDYHLLPDSPCIDAGDPCYIAEPDETDLDGNPRVIGGRIDMGAYELAEPVVLLDFLAQNIIDLELQRGIANSLLAKLNTALQKLEDDNENNDAAAINLLEAFINAVEAQRGKKIPEADADALIEAVQEIIDLLSNR